MFRRLMPLAMRNARSMAARQQRASAVRAFSSAATEEEKLVLAEVRGEGKVGLITLNRPKALNALCDKLVKQLNAQLKAFDADPNIGAIVITGSEKSFAAGADIKEMAPQTYATAQRSDMLAFWHDITQIKKPIIAAVNGYALGGGCELAMMCDIIIAGDKAKFGQPEITIGTMPGCGGTQRLTRAVGKSKAMEWILTGEMFTAEQAERAGLVSRVVAADQLVDNAIKTATKIANFSQPVVALTKEAVNAAYETTLNQGVIFERRLFHATFALDDRKIGMEAFVSKQAPQWKNQ